MEYNRGSGIGFPYTDFHRLNLDWVIEQVTNMGTRLDGIVKEAVGEANAYTDSTLAEIRADFNNLNAQIDAKLNTLDSDFDKFKDLVRADLYFQNKTIEELEIHLNQRLDDSEARTDAAIALAIEKLYDRILTEFSEKVRVVDYFTGDMVTVQYMFDQLAQFHVTSSMTFQEVADVAKTFQQAIDFGATFKEIVQDPKKYFK